MEKNLLIKNRLLIGALVASVSISYPLRAADFGYYLGKQVNEFEQGMLGLATCTRRPYASTLPIITPQTKVVRDLFHPVSGTLLHDDAVATFQSNAVVILGCEIENAAGLQLYALWDKIFRINVVYTRCKTTAASGACLETDEEERQYDRSLYASLEHKDAYQLSADGSYSGVYRELRRDPLLKRYIDEVSCGPWVSDFVFGRNREDRCIVDVSLDNGHLSATTVFEVFDKGHFSSTLVGRYAGTRTFIDIDAEQAALDEILPELNQLVAREKAQIAASKAKEEDRTQRVEEFLGGN